MTGDPPVLQPGIVYVCEANLDATPERVIAARAVLARQERARADRFVGSVHRRRYTVAQAHLRHLLGWFVGLPAGDLGFSFGPHGKPSLARGPSFNQSHSGEHLVIGVARHGRLGIDVEKLRPVPRMLRLAERRFAPDEFRRLAEAPEPTQCRLFFRMWTAKEAFTKALGTGLTIRLSSFSVQPGDEGPDGTGNRVSALVRARDTGEESSEWMVGHLSRPASSVAAFALDYPGARVRRLPYNPDHW